MPDTTRRVEGIPTVPEPTRELLTDRQLADYREHRASLLEWALTLGKKPTKAEGYAHTTVEGRAYRLDLFCRWVWDEYGGYTTNVTHDHADAYMQHLAYKDSSQDDKASHMKAIKMLFRWRAWGFDGEEWEPEISYSNDSSTTNPRDYLTVDERTAIREAALEYGSVPAYNALSPGARDSWKAHLAQRFEKAKRDVTQADFERANSWKMPSLIWTALDTGLRPVEVERSRIQWVDTANSVLRIPKEESSKNEDNWVVSITDRTANALDRWLTERDQYEKYNKCDAIWLNREANPYKYYSLNRILRDVCEIAGIPIENRDMTWYSIRHSVGTGVAREEGLAAAQAQLRHKSWKTTLRYDQADADSRRDALNRMG